MAEYIRFENVRNPKIKGVCTLEEFEKFNSKQALRGKYRIIQRNVVLNENVKPTFQHSPTMTKVKEPEEVQEALVNKEKKDEEVKKTTRRKRKSTKSKDT